MGDWMYNEKVRGTGRTIDTLRPGDIVTYFGESEEMLVIPGNAVILLENSSYETKQMPIKGRFMHRAAVQFKVCTQPKIGELVTVGEREVTKESKIYLVLHDGFWDGFSVRKLRDLAKRRGTFHISEEPFCFVISRHIESALDYYSFISDERKEGLMKLYRTGNEENMKLADDLLESIINKRMDDERGTILCAKRKRFSSRF